MRKITLLALMATMSLGAFAQDLDEERVVLSTTVDSVYTTEIVNPSKYTVETNSFGHNWFINAGAGMNIFLGDHSSSMKNLWDMSSWSADLSFGKWFTPGIGVRLGANIGNAVGMSGWTGHTRESDVNQNNYQGFIVYDKNNKAEVYADKLPNTSYETYKTRMQFLIVGADVMFNLSNMIWGYKADRVYSFIPYAGVGYATSLNKAYWYINKNKEDYGRRTSLVSFTGGILNKFRLSESFDFNIDIKAQYTGDQFDQQWFSHTIEDRNIVSNGSGRSLEGLLSTTLGFTYNILPEWQKSVHTTVRVNDNVLADLNNRLADLDKLNSDLRSQLESALNREVTKENVAAQPLLVTFQIDRWKLSTKDRVNLGFLAEAIKANPDVVYSVTGFADKGTGSVKRNIFLAKKRAEVVYNALVNEFGVSENQLRKDSKGGVANMYYNDPRNSRAVLMKVAE